MDETSVKVDGVNYWLWVFTTTICTLFVVRKSRGKKVLVEVLGSGFGGFIGCDGHKAIAVFQIVCRGVGLICCVRRRLWLRIMWRLKSSILGCVSSFMILIAALGWSAGLDGVGC